MTLAERLFVGAARAPLPLWTPYAHWRAVVEFLIWVELRGYE